MVVKAKYEWKESQLSWIEKLREYKKEIPDEFEDYSDFEAFQKEVEASVDLMLKLYRAYYDNLSEKTLNRQVEDLSFYLYDFLSERYGNSPFLFINEHPINEFFGYFYIHKCMWSTPASIKAYLAAFKKFSAMMLEAGLIDKKDYDRADQLIKEKREDWCEDCRKFNDPDYDYFGEYI